MFGTALSLRLRNAGHCSSRARGNGWAFLVRLHVLLLFSPFRRRLGQTCGRLLENTCCCVFTCAPKVVDENGSNRPVLKHGPRSATSMRVFGWQTRGRNESEVFVFRSRSRIGSFFSLLGKDGTIARPGGLLFPKGLRQSMFAATRKMVNYACIGRSQRKLWWRLVAILTCKSIVECGYRGERLIEPSSSWFPPKFPFECSILGDKSQPKGLASFFFFFSFLGIKRSDIFKLRGHPKAAPTKPAPKGCWWPS